MNILATHPRVEAAQLPLESLAGNANVSDSDKVVEVSRQFEAVLLRQILSDIRKPVLAAAEGDATTAGIYNDMINNQMAESISRSGGFGLAKSLATQLTHQVLPHSALSHQASPTPVRAVRAKSKSAHNSMIKSIKILIEALREELQHYGEMLALLDLQQSHLVARAASVVFQSISLIKAQGISHSASPAPAAKIAAAPWPKIANCRKRRASPS